MQQARAEHQVSVAYRMMWVDGLECKRTVSDITVHACNSKPVDTVFLRYQRVGGDACNHA
jgi:hypothetical protein